MASEGDLAEKRVLAERKLKEEIATATAEVKSLQTAKTTVAVSGVCWCVLFPCLFMVKNKHGTFHVNRIEEKMQAAEDVKEDLEYKLEQLQRYGQLPEQTQQQLDQQQVEKQQPKK